MDALIAAGLAVVETAIYIQRHGPHTGYSAAWTIWSCFFTQYLAFKFYRIFLYPHYCSPLWKLPGPRDNHVFFGQTINLLRAKTPTSLYLKWMQEHPSAPCIRYLSIANKEVLVANSLQSHKDLLQTHCYSFKKPDGLRRILKEIAGDGIFMLEGERHKSQRKIISGFFSPTRLRLLEPIFKSMAQRAIHSLERSIPAGDPKEEVILNCTEVFSNITLDIIGAATLGVELGSITQADGSSSTDIHTFHEAYNAIFTLGWTGRVLTWANGFFPTRWVPVRANRRFIAATSWITAALTQTARDRHHAELQNIGASSQRQDAPYHDLLTYLVRDGIAGGPAKDINENELVGHLLQVMVAGHETSAITLSWLVYIMATNQHIQTTLRAEISELLRETASPTFGDINKLVYLNGAVIETLRIYSPATTIHRQAEAEIVIDEVVVPKGTAIDMVPSVVIRNPVIWGDDADEVDPTRWTRLVSDQQSPYAFEAFSNGPRICVGRSFALCEIKIILFEMIRNFWFLEVAEPFIIENPSLTLRPAGLKVRCRQV
ncbi:cytochrome P450 [Astrocystis sublimbata]|nr:cytochrome P450 [Astrocystis sublimbata]